MRHELLVLPDARALAAAAAAEVAQRARETARHEATVSWALSGGRTPGLMFEALAAADVPWDRVVVYQVDERVAPRGDPARNATSIAALVGRTAARFEAMPVEDVDLEAAARAYGAALPHQLDLVHLGLGADGHTASLVPGDPVLEDEDDLVALTGAYEGHRRMTLTYRALARADLALWLVAGAEKRAALAALVRGDAPIPAGAVNARRSLILADAAAAGGLGVDVGGAS